MGGLGAAYDVNVWLWVPCFSIWLVLAAVSDLRHRRVSNRLNGLFALTGLAVGVGLGGQGGLLTSLAGLFTGFGLMAVPFGLRVYRGGDAKLVIAAGCWLGPLGTCVMFVAGVILGGALGLAMVMKDRQERRRVAKKFWLAWFLRSGEAVLEPDEDARPTVPMALAFGVGGLVAALMKQLIGVLG